MRLRVATSDLKGRERNIVVFHINESNRIREAVTRYAGLSQPGMPDLPNATPGLRSFIRKIQFYSWRWRIWYNFVFWPGSVEQAWQEVFADENFRAVTEHHWKRYFDIRDSPRQHNQQQQQRTFTSRMIKS